ncbi:MAG: LON peptidase substrate-binding domain-containing protein [Gammaproteobacteria bacterium]|nr:LON peptidase substrate-binding domain-containing protein [Gammaproteobacteria bacterium]
MADLREIPLFPLGVVLFEGGRLPLRIFEPRYLDMISERMREDSPFGIVLIRSGVEARVGDDAPDEAGASAPEIFEVGTYARVVDFNALDGGLLGIVVEGGAKFRIHKTWEQYDRLLRGLVETLPAEPSGTLGEADQPVIDILRALLKHPMVEKLGLEVDFGDAGAVSRQLAELLPVEPEIKQSLLQLGSPTERLNELRRLVTRLRG